MPNFTTPGFPVPSRSRHRILMCASIVFAALVATAALAGNATQVSVEVGQITVPTYTFGEAPNTAPLFEVGNGKGIYPYGPLDRDSLSASPQPISYQSITIENDYLRVVFLPELGGRIWSAWDKQTQRNLFYTDSVIKPSAYNQRGGWPVGNLEVYGPFDAHMLTWPGEPWPWTIQHHSDGSATVILSHIDHFFRDKLFMEVTLRPGRSFVELTLRLHNRNQLPNRYLLWTNAGIPATEGTRFVYPMTRTIGHDTEDFGSWPVYRGVDLSWYRNNKTMLGVFGLDVYDDFLAAYDYTADHGTVCAKNHQIARGIKTWTWGTGQTGMRHLESYADSGLPYIEVQSGRFVWDGNYEFIAPGESDGWTEYWYGASGLGGLTTATPDLAVRLATGPDGVEAVLLPTGDFSDASFSWAPDGRPEYATEPINLRAGQPLRKLVPVETSGQVKSIRVRVTSGDATLLDYRFNLDGEPPKGEFAADAIPRDFGPSDSLTLEELYLKGLTEEKLGRADRAEAAYREALQRDPLYVAPNLRLGLIALSRFQEEEALKFFNQALDRAPSDSELHYLIGVTLTRMGRDEDAREHFYRVIPSAAQFDQRDFNLGLIALRKGDVGQALGLLQTAAKRLPEQSSAQQAYAFSLRREDRRTEAEPVIARLVSADPTSAFAAAELGFWDSWPEARVEALDQVLASHPQGYLELATEYMKLGAWKEVQFLADLAIRAASRNGGSPYPILLYYRADALDHLGETDQARALLADASRTDVKISFFPFRRETVSVLEACLELLPRDSNAASLLGDLYYSRQRHDEAIKLWEAAADWNPAHFSSLRNLGWAFLARGDSERAVGFLERALQVRPDHLETATSLTQLYARLGKTDQALAVIEQLNIRNPKNDQVVELTARIRALAGDVNGSLSLLNDHQFGIRHQSYSLLHLYQSVQLLKSVEEFRKGAIQEALLHVDAAAHVPANLGVDDFAALKSSRLLAFRALLLEASGDRDRSLEAWNAAAETVDQDFDGEGLFRAIALAHIGKRESAARWFTEFEQVNPTRQKDNDAAVRIHATYLAGIYAIYRGESRKGLEGFNRALDGDASDMMVRHAIAAFDAGILSGLPLPTR